jgi:hypothetical protein
MIHLDWPNRRSLVFDVATLTFPDRRVERGRLLSERECIGCVACDAGRRLDPLVRGVTGLALLSEESVRG